MRSEFGFSVIFIAGICLLVYLAYLNRIVRGDQLLSENGFIVEKQYYPDTRQTVTGTGISTNGDLVLTTHHVGQDEQYILIFRCEHKVVFSINNKKLYSDLEKGDSVKIFFYELLNRKGQVIDYEFINSEKF